MHFFSNQERESERQQPSESVQLCTTEGRGIECNYPIDSTDATMELSTLPEDCQGLQLYILEK